MSENKQTVKIEAGYSFDRATEVIMELILNGLKERVDKIPVKKIEMQVAHKYPGYMGTKDFIPKEIVLQLIDEVRNE